MLPALGRSVDWIDLACMVGLGGLAIGLGPGWRAGRCSPGGQAMSEHAADRALPPTRHEPKDIGLRFMLGLFALIGGTLLLMLALAFAIFPGAVKDRDTRSRCRIFHPPGYSRARAPICRNSTPRKWRD